MKRPKKWPQMHLVNNRNVQNGRAGYTATSVAHGWALGRAVLQEATQVLWQERRPPPLKKKEATKNAGLNNMDGPKSVRYSRVAHG